MSVPFRTCAESITMLSLQLANKLASSSIGSFYNFAHRQIVSSTQWTSRETDTLIATVDEYSTGTVTATQGSATIVGTGTAFTTPMVNRFIRIGGTAGDVQYYRIINVTSPTALVVELPYVSSTQAAVGFVIFGLRYALPSNCRTPELYAAGNTNPIPQRDPNYIQFADPNRYISSNTPQYWTLFGIDDNAASPTYGCQLIEFWPRFSAASAVRLQYYKEADDISGSQRPIMRSDLVEYLTLHMCCMALHNEFGDPHWKVSADDYLGMYKELLEQEQREDLQRNAATDQIKWHRSVVRGAHYHATHDVE